MRGIPLIYLSHANPICLTFCISYLRKNLIVKHLNKQQSAKITHNHSEGIKGTQAVAAAVFLAHKGESKESIRNYIEITFNYNLNMTCDDSDTLACITGAIAQAYYIYIPDFIVVRILTLLPKSFIQVIEQLHLSSNSPLNP